MHCVISYEGTLRGILLFGRWIDVSVAKVTSRHCFFRWVETYHWLSALTSVIEVISLGVDELLSLTDHTSLLPDHVCVEDEPKLIDALPLCDHCPRMNSYD